MADINRRAVLIAAVGAVVPAEIPISAAHITTLGCIESGVIPSGAELVPAMSSLRSSMMVRYVGTITLTHGEFLEAAT